MSTTFAIDSVPTGAFTAYCFEQDLTLGPVEGHDAILSLIVAHKETCEECAHYGLYSEAVMDVTSGLDVNLANGNARLVLTILGLDSEDLCGATTAEDFLGRVLLAMAEDRDDTGVRPAVVSGREVGTSGPTMVDCGIRPGYFADRFGALHALATEALRLGREVVWA